MLKSSHFEAGVKFLENGNYLLASEQFALSLVECPESTEVLSLQAICLIGLRQSKEAERVLTNLLEIDPNNYDGLTWLAEQKRAKGALADAINLSKKAIGISPDSAEAYGVLGNCYIKLGLPDEAIVILKQAVSIAPNFEPYHHYLAQAYSLAQKTALMQKELEISISLEPRNPQNYLMLSAYLAKYGLAGRALDILSNGLKQLPKNAQLHSQAASTFSLLRNDRAAESHHLEAVRLSPEARSSYGFWLVDQGRFQEASAIFSKLVEENGKLGIAYYGLSQCQKGTVSDPQLLRKMENLATDSTQSPISKMYINYALGKTCDQMKSFEQAMRYLDQANQLAYQIHSPLAPFQLNKIRSDKKLVLNCYEKLRDRNVVGLSGSSPIFIVGMIRSGTTLLDQIVTSHSQISGGGELRFWIEKSLWLAAQSELVSEKVLQALAQEYIDYIHQIADDAPSHTDKMPLNYGYLGIIHQAFPNARFLHIKRNPLDTCLSIYSTYFGPGSQFVYNKANTVDYYREYLDVMEYWRGCIPSENFLEIEYEDLIFEKETVTKKIIDFCGHRWEDGCLRHEENQSAINTPSRWQARQPVYSSSVGRWKNYEPWLGEFGQLIAPSDDSH